MGRGMREVTAGNVATRKIKKMPPLSLYCPLQTVWRFAGGSISKRRWLYGRTVCCRINRDLLREGRECLRHHDLLAKSRPLVKFAQGREPVARIFQLFSALLIIDQVD